MASSILKGLVANYGKLGYQLWHRPFKMASLVYEREIGFGGIYQASFLEFGGAMVRILARRPMARPNDPVPCVVPKRTIRY